MLTEMEGDRGARGLKLIDWEVVVLGGFYVYGIWCFTCDRWFMVVAM
jgi:hypothetical protein